MQPIHSIVVYKPNKENKALRTPIPEKDYSDEATRLHLAEVMKKHTHYYGGIGLAANQLGLNERVFNANGVIYFNPQIISYSEPTISGKESCLSLPGVSTSVERHTELVVRYTNVDGESVDCILVGMDAIVFQHELDHLNGIIIADHISSKFKRDKFWTKYKKQLRKISN